MFCPIYRKVWSNLLDYLSNIYWNRWPYQIRLNNNLMQLMRWNLTLSDQIRFVRNLRFPRFPFSRALHIIPVDVLDTQFYTLWSRDIGEYMWKLIVSLFQSQSKIKAGQWYFVSVPTLTSHITFHPWGLQLEANLIPLHYLCREKTA